MPKIDLRFNPEEYAPVAERIRLFYERYPVGRIITHLISRSDNEVVFRAEVFRLPGDREPAATGWAAEREGDGDINTVACLENTETSAIGRALANLGLTAARQRPSAEEMQRPSRLRSPVPQPPQDERGGGREVGRARSRRDYDALQQAADAVMDALGLLAEAERAGFDPVRVDELTEELLAPDVPPSVVARAEGIARRWLAALDTESAGGLSEPDPSAALPPPPSA
jgi:hypothetical protein